MEKSISFSCVGRLAAFRIAHGNSNLKLLFMFSKLGALEVNSDIFRMMETALFVIITVTNRLLGSCMWTC